MTEKPFILPIRTPLGSYIYEINKNEIIWVNNDLYNYITSEMAGESNRSVSEKIALEYEELKACGYLSNKCVEKVHHPATEQVEVLLNRAIEKLTLQVTQDCNLRCKYCIYSCDSNPLQRSHTHNKMSIQTAKAAIDFYRRRSSDAKRISIGFYGGEPLLEYKLIVESVYYAEEVFAGKKVDFYITTNATLLTPEIVEFFLSHNFHIMFSIDGPKNIQDKNRIYPNGNGTYDRVIQNIRCAYELDKKQLLGDSLSMVVSPLHEYKDLQVFLAETALHNLNVTTSYIDCDGDTILPSPEYIANHTYDIFISLLFTLRESSEKGINKLIDQDIVAFNKSNILIAESVLSTISAPGGPCVPGKVRLMVDCHGNMYPCERVNESELMRIGSVYSDFDFDKVKQLLNVGEIASENCKHCFAFGLCNVCARALDDGETLSPERKLKACESSRSSAYYMLLNKIVKHEYYKHMLKMERRCCK